MEYIITPTITFILVLITSYYAWQTRRTVKEMQEARKFEFLPIISIRIWHPNDEYNQIVIATNNIGRGLAQNPKLYVPSKADPFILENMSEGAGGSTLVDIQPSTVLRLLEEKRKIKVEYFDIFNRKIISEALIEPNDPEKLDNSELELKNWSLVLPDNFQKKPIKWIGIVGLSFCLLGTILLAMPLLDTTKNINDDYIVQLDQSTGEYTQRKHLNDKNFGYTGLGLCVFGFMLQFGSMLIKK